MASVNYDQSQLANFLKALDDVKEELICSVCSEICKNPITLSVCFHTICSEHFDRLKNCPKCDASLEGCKTFSDEKLEKCYDAGRQLTEIFDKYKPHSSASCKGENTDSPRKIASSLHKTTPQKSNKSDALESDKPPGEKSNFSKKHKNEIATSKLNLSLSRINKSLEKRNNKGETVLHVACRVGKMDKVEEYLKEGANPNTKDNAGWTPLHEAVQNGNFELVQLLLQYNTLINVPGQSNETPLHEAVRYEHLEIAELLVKHGADINIRNCKGETPLQLACGRMKEILEIAAENIIQSQSVNLKFISKLYSELDFDDIKILCLSKMRTVHNKLKTLTKYHKNVHIESIYTKKVTHIVVDTDSEDGKCNSSLEILQGIVCGIWILSQEWIIKSSQEKLEPFESHEVKGVKGAASCNGPRNARFNKYKLLPGIFDGCHFYLHNISMQYVMSDSIIVTKAVLSKLITDAGGKVLRRAPNPESIPENEKLVPYHAKEGSKLWICSHYILYKDNYEPMYNMQHLKALPIGWLVECIEKYELCDPW